MQFATILKALTLSALVLGLAGANPIGGCGGCSTGCEVCAPQQQQVVRYVSRPVVYTHAAPAAPAPAPCAESSGVSYVEAGASYGGAEYNTYGHGGAVSYGESSGAACETCGAPRTVCRTRNVIQKHVRLVPQTVYRNQPITECTTCQTCSKPGPACVCN